MLKFIKKNKTTILLLIVMLVGAGLLAYPSVANWWNSFHQSRAIASYTEVVEKMDESEYEAMLRDAEAYNASIVNAQPWNMTPEQEAVYSGTLDVTGTGIMGYVDIKKIRIQLPIYHGTNESVLSVAIGHLQGTSLPVGGENTHCVISGHRGLPSARLFTDLDRLKEGDIFVLHSMNRTMTYEVDQIRIVEPADLSELQIIPGMDLCTLVTCTPYGINTHRLLVRGHRIPNPDGDANITADALVIDPLYIAPAMAIPVLLLLLLWLLLSTSRFFTVSSEVEEVVNADLEELDEELRRKEAKKE